jgi:ABC-type spermidine/putrescine transport system permease subunit II
MTAQELIVVADSYGLTSARLVATSAAFLGLFGAIVGGLALTRSRRRGTGSGRRGAIVALVSGVISAGVGVLSLAAADGGPGTGNGVVGAYLAVVLGAVGLATGGMVLSRSRSVRAR